jgi:opacity protein-like surface antigen
VRRCPLLTALTLCLFLLTGLASAADETPRSSDLYVRDRITLQVVSGPLFASSAIGPRIPDFDYWQTNVRLGWMLSSPQGGGHRLDGNLEAILEVTNSFVFNGFGDYVGGVAGLIRYNLTGFGDRFVPYVQAGAGLVVTDAHDDRSQRAIGRAINGSLRAGAGFRYLMGKNWSLDAEAAFEHISNADTADRNDGVNALGGFVGITYFWDDLWK